MGGGGIYLFTYIYIMPSPLSPPFTNPFFIFLLSYLFAAISSSRHKHRSPYFQQSLFFSTSTMAQLIESSTLTSAPSIVGQLVTEPLIADDEGPIVNSIFSGIPGLGEIIDASVVAVSRAVTGVITGQNPNDVIAGIIPSIAEIVQASRAGTLAIPLDQMARLAVNSPEFYCVVGAVAAASPVAPPHVIATRAQGAQRDFPSLWYVNFPHIMSGYEVEAVKRNRKSMTNFRSWSSKKWWEEVGRRFGVADEAIQRARQSKQFAEIACEDMVKMSW